MITPHSSPQSKNRVSFTLIFQLTNLHIKRQFSVLFTNFNVMSSLDTSFPPPPICIPNRTFSLQFLGSTKTDSFSHDILNAYYLVLPTYHFLKAFSCTIIGDTTLSFHHFQPQFGAPNSSSPRSKMLTHNMHQIMIEL